VDEHGPVIIDLPQAVDAAANNNAEAMLERDVNKISSYYGEFAPQLLETGYAKEIWKLYEEGDLQPDSELTGLFAENTQTADVDDMLRIIESAIEEEKDKQERKIEAENQP